MTDDERHEIKILPADPKLKSWPYAPEKQEIVNYYRGWLPLSTGQWMRLSRAMN